MRVSPQRRLARVSGTLLGNRRHTAAKAETTGYARAFRQTRLVASSRRLRDFGSPYPAALMESLPELRGTRAWSVVPRLGCESIERVPFTSFSRSSMLISPSPRLALA